MKIKTEWLGHLRARREEEFALVAKNLPKRRYAVGLELGARDGFQSGMLSKYADRLVVTDYSLDGLLARGGNENIEYKQCDAEDVARVFENRKFDIVFSSNLLEHLPDPSRAISGIYDILNDDGVCVHCIPNSFWVIVRLILFYPNALASLLERTLNRISVRRGDRVSSAIMPPDTDIYDNNPKYPRPRRPRIYPSPHGAYKSNLREIWAYRKSEWESRFKKNGFEMLGVVNGPVMSGYGFGFDRLRKALVGLGMCSEFIYIMKKSARPMSVGKKKTLFVIPAIHGGGAQTQMRYIFEHLASPEFELHLAFFHATGKENEVVPEYVKTYDIGTRLRPSGLFLAVKLFFLMRRLKPSVVLSFIWGANLMSIAAARLLKIPVVAGERIFLSSDISEYSLAVARKWLVKKLYPLAALVVANSRAAALDLAENFHIPSGKIIVIPNAVDAKAARLKSREYDVGMKDYVLGVGRLERQKNFGLLMDALYVLRKEKDYPLVLLGVGAELNKLTAKAARLGVRLFTPGFVENPYPWMKNAAVLAMTSLYEGMPNVVLEAMACGCPVVAYGGAGGVGDIIENSTDGIIVARPSAEDVAAGLRAVLSDEVLRNRLSANGEKKALEFGIDAVMNQWKKVLSAAAARPSVGRVL